MSPIKTLAVAAASTLLFSATTASAAIIYANSVDEVNRGLVTTSAAEDASRSNTANALGAPDGSFYSMGLGGDITLGFGQVFNTSSANIKSYEVTFGSIANYPESVDIFAVLGGTVGDFIGSLSNVQANAGVKLSYNGTFDALKFVDTSNPPGPPNFDGFDVDAVGVNPVPLPAAGFLLLGALGGLGAMRRRKTA